MKVWEIPDGGLITGENLTEYIADLRGHSRRVGQIEWHPTAENILASAAHDCMVRFAECSPIGENSNIYLS